MKRFLATWTINTLAVLVAANTVSGLHYDGLPALLCASLLLGVFNALLRPIRFLLLPLVILTLGVVRFVMNALVLYFIGHLLAPHFYVTGFWGAFWGALVISVMTIILSLMTGTNQARVTVQKPPHIPPRNRPGDDGGGPVIDV